MDTASTIASYNGIMFASQLTALTEHNASTLPYTCDLAPASVSHALQTVVNTLVTGTLECSSGTPVPQCVNDTAKSTVANALGESPAELEAQLSCPGFPSSGCVPWAAFAIPASCQKAAGGLYECDAPGATTPKYNCSAGLLETPTLTTSLAQFSSFCDSRCFLPLHALSTTTQEWYSKFVHVLKPARAQRRAISLWFHQRRRLLWFQGEAQRLHGRCCSR